MKQLLFFAFSALGLLIGHISVYFLLMKVFSFSSSFSKAILMLVISTLFLGVLLSSYLIHVKDNVLIRFLYIFFSLWLGVLLNLILIAIFLFLAKITLNCFNISISLLYYQSSLIILTLLVSLLAVYRALVPTVVEYEAYIKDLPDAWDGKSIVHISDLHLGPVYRLNFINNLVKRINSLEPEAVFISGDFFDGMEADFSWLDKPLSDLKTKKGVYYGFGNHDLYLGFEKVSKLMADKKLVILDNKLVEVDGLQIIGINYSFRNDFDLEAEILYQSGYDKSKASVLIFHTPTNIELAKKAGIDLQLSGHTHDGQLFPFNLPAKWMHDGYGYGIFKENGFNLVVSAGIGTWGPPMRTTARSEIVKILLKKQ